MNPSRIRSTRLMWRLVSWPVVLGMLNITTAKVDGELFRGEEKTSEEGDSPSWQEEGPEAENEEVQEKGRTKKKSAKKNSLVANINRRKKAGKSRSKKKSMVSKESYDQMQKGWPKAKRKRKKRV